MLERNAKRIDATTDPFAPEIYFHKKVLEK